MSTAILKGNASGTGSMTLESPNTNSNRTVTVPDVDGQIMVSSAMPAFSAYLSSNQTVSSATFTKIQCNTEEFDTNSNYDNATNYRFTPTVAGYYQINGGMQGAGFTNYTETLISIYKNGTEFKRGTYVGISTTNTNSSHVNANALIYFNGSTDYVELYGYLNGSVGTPVFLNGVAITYFQGVLVRAA